MDDPKRWRPALVGLGVLFLLAAVVLECMLLFQDHTKTVRRAHHVVTTVTDGSAPSGGLVTGAFALGVVCLLVAALWDRITKISVAGVDIQLDAAFAAKLGAATRDVTRDQPHLFEPVFAESWALLQSKSVTPDTTEYVAQAQPAQVEDATAWRAVTLAMQSVQSRSGTP